MSANGRKRRAKRTSARRATDQRSMRTKSPQRPEIVHGIDIKRLAVAIAVLRDSCAMENFSSVYMEAARRDPDLYSAPEGFSAYEELARLLAPTLFGPPPPEVLVEDMLFAHADDGPHERTERLTVALAAERKHLNRALAAAERAVRA